LSRDPHFGTVTKKRWEKREKDSHALNEKRLRFQRKQETKSKENLCIKKKSWSPNKLVDRTQNGAIFAI